MRFKRRGRWGDKKKEGRWQIPPTIIVAGRGA
jgi:hypothetical protein